MIRGIEFIQALLIQTFDYFQNFKIMNIEELLKYKLIKVSNFSLLTVNV